MYDVCPICAGSGRDALERVADARGVNVQDLERGLGGHYEPNIRDYNPIDGTFACCRCNAGLLPPAEGQIELSPEIAGKIAALLASL